MRVYLINNRFILLSLCVTGFFVFLFFKLNAMPIQATHQPIQTDTADSFVTAATVFRLNRDGQIIRELYTDKITYFLKKNRTDFLMPHLIVRGKSENPWIIDANHGSAKNGTAEIQLWDQVKIHHEKDEAAQTSTLLTEALTLYPEKKEAQTNKPIIFKQPGLAIEAVGLKANLNDSTLQLLSNARGHYEEVGEH